jgi:flagellum-specific peptidoglycan hydrolase FlgJ
MENIIPLGEPTDIYADLVYTPTEYNLSTPEKEDTPQSTLDWASNFLSSHGSSTKTEDTSEGTSESTSGEKDTWSDYWSAWNNTDTEEPTASSSSDIKITKPKTGDNMIYTSNDSFKSDLYNMYIKVLKASNINPEFAKYLVAQDALESNWGKSSLSAYNNFGGIKATAGSKFVEKQTKEWDATAKKMKTVSQKFRVFDSLEDYCKYKVSLLGNSNYKTFTRKPEQFADSLTTLAKYKYATDPNYKMKIDKMVKQMWG